MASDVQPAPEWLTAREAAALLRSSRSTVYRLADSGQLAGAKAVGGGTIRRSGFRVPRASVEEHLANAAYQTAGAA